VADTQIVAGGVVAAPLAYTIPGSQEIIIKSLFASFDGTGAAGAFLPTVRIVAPGGKVVGEYITDASVSAGSSAEVSFAPFLRSGTGGGMVVIFDSLLTANAANFDIQGIPQNFRSLLLLTNLRTNGVAVNADSAVVVNNNTTPTNYFYQNTAGSQVSSGVSSIMCSSVGSSADVNHTAQSVIWCHDYATFGIDHSFAGHAGSIPVEANTATWYARAFEATVCATDSAAISRLTISPNVGTAWVPPSRVTLYGVG
jgi:hypothetical protein